MPIPNYQSLMLPILKFLGDRREHSLKEIIAHMYENSKLPETEKRQLLPSGREKIFSNRIRWARWYLEKAGLIKSPRRAFSIITRSGLDVLRKNPSEINVKYLEQFPEFAQYIKSKKESVEKTKPRESVSLDNVDPTELLDSAYQNLKSTLLDDLLNEVRKGDPSFFENLVITLLVKMGYGGSREDAGKAIGQTGDEGIDGIIKEDKLGLDAVYIQAKKWKAAVGRPKIQEFVGALKGRSANKGVFITTSTFTKEAIKYTSKIESPKIVLIDGVRLAELMFEFDVGVFSEASYEVKRIDSEFFYG